MRPSDIGRFGYTRRASEIGQTRCCLLLFVIWDQDETFSPYKLHTGADSGGPFSHASFCFAKAAIGCEKGANGGIFSQQRACFKTRRRKLGLVSS